MSYPIPWQENHSYPSDDFSPVRKKFKNPIKRSSKKKKSSIARKMVHKKVSNPFKKFKEIDKSSSSDLPPEENNPISASWR